MNQIHRSDRIGLIIPTRARTEKLKALFDSLEASVEDPSHVEAWLYVDDDDSASIDFSRSATVADYSFHIEWHVAGRTPSNGEMINLLARECSNRCSILFPIADDYVFETKGWDRSIRDCFAAYDDRIALAFPDEATATRDQVTIAIVGSNWMRTTGRLFTPYFPFWYDDSWVDEVGQMIGRKHKLAITVNPQGGKGKTMSRMRNLAFWSSMFNLLLDERVTEAEKLLHVIHRDDAARLATSIAQAHRKALELVRPQVNLRDPIYAERMFSGDEIAGPPSPRYLQIELSAVQHLLNKACAALRQGTPQRALDLVRPLTLLRIRRRRIQIIRAAALYYLEEHSHAIAALDEEVRNGGDATTAQRMRMAIDEHNAGLEAIEGITTRAIAARAPLDTHLGTLDRIMLAAMPVTLRIQLLISTLRSNDIREWPSALFDIAIRFARRRSR